MKILPPKLDLENCNGFDANDIFNRQKAGDALSNIVCNTDKMVIALNGNWGTGKTTFIRMWQKSVQQNNPNIKTIYYDAFANDHAKDIFLTLTQSICTTFKSRETKNKIIEPAKKVGFAITKEALKIATKSIATKILYEDADQDIAKIAHRLTDSAYDQLSTERNEIEIQYNRFKKALSDVTHEGNKPKPIVFIIDELDRCRPDYALEFIETIKHGFDTKGIIFILSVNRDSLNAMIAKRYGRIINGDNYFQKFVDIWFTLPNILENFDNNSISYKYYNELFHKMTEGNTTKIELAKSYLEDLIKFHNPTLRQVEKILTNLAITNATITDGIINEHVQFAIACSCFIKTCKTNVYDEICNQKCGKTTFYKSIIENGNKHINMTQSTVDKLNQLIEFDWRDNDHNYINTKRSTEVPGFLVHWMQLRNDKIIEFACNLANMNIRTS